MAHFFGKLIGGRGETTRLGTKASGLQATAQGWDIGARVEVNHVDGTDVVTIHLTHGSNDATAHKTLGSFKIDAAGAFVPCTVKGLTFEEFHRQRNAEDAKRERGEM